MSAADTSATEPAAEPTAAERIRSVLSRAGSLTLTTDGYRCDLVGLHTVDERGRLRIRLPADSPLAARAVCAPRGTLAVLLEFTDIAPAAVRDRVRARVTLSGWLTPDAASGCGAGAGAADDEGGAGAPDLRLDAVRATLETADGTVAVGLDQLVLAAPDPLAADEAAMLTHLADAHEDVVAQLTRLADPRLLHSVIRVRPLALDRYGVTLRYEYARGHRDIRIPFPGPVREPADTGEQVQRLLAAARTCPRRRRASSRR
ncbi:hypothetical protein SSP35_04_01680 [Streptomyces sp. NBRC 110611]|uniref:DUF2470 domain-containing protein n=1 Tax=Streptomyces sp. NBRC 110611 TaxID=1621259 RepID=UPI00082D5DEC|nr:DUF2470 domain-containing protein [Streptomyces sp. NBRC 110611]GAU67087.1 hypothetical protein SSP35_04_01680 [Streptomyces sp. NBRC 110611]